VAFDDDALRAIIQGYTREAGLRNLEREIGRVCRKVARRRAEGQTAPVQCTAALVRELLGPERFYPEVAERSSEPGVAIGLAWTPAGGDILFIEASRMAGTKQLTLTGQLRDVMKESAQTALSWVRAHAAELGIDPDFFERSDIHIHVPQGAIPKDGPSAGITMAAAIASLLSGRPVRPRLAMTGEITLRGRVLPVGGTKEKILAARRAGIEMVILPAHNASDLEDVPAHVREQLTFVFVETMSEVLTHSARALSKSAPGRPRDRPPLAPAALRRRPPGRSGSGRRRAVPRRIPTRLRRTARPRLVRCRDRSASRRP
jgi:ATP-dependent Lon protease